MSELALSPHVRRELDFDRTIKRGDRGAAVRRVQEWISYNGLATAVDGQFGAATEQCVAQFQSREGLAQKGEVDEATWAALVRPMAEAVAGVPPRRNDTLPDHFLRSAQVHLKQHPIEMGGDNRGPWVRLYLAGNEGSRWYWCAGFVTFVLRQACEGLGIDMPIAGSFSCDLLASQAQATERFIRGASIERNDPGWDELGSAQIFLVRRTSSDWIHTGISFQGRDDIFSTIEGNTNDEGGSNGYEVCQRTRSIPAKDFIRLTA